MEEKSFIAHILCPGAAQGAGRPTETGHRQKPATRSGHNRCSAQNKWIHRSIPIQRPARRQARHLPSSSVWPVPLSFFLVRSPSPSEGDPDFKNGSPTLRVFVARLPGGRGISTSIPVSRAWPWGKDPWNTAASDGILSHPQLSTGSRADDPAIEVVESGDPARQCDFFSIQEFRPVRVIMSDEECVRSRDRGLDGGGIRSVSTVEKRG